MKMLLTCVPASKPLICEIITVM
uniref:Uncharacterized protein n=1 Tax=Anguilla anguilla TaxID=7936 RepID=A0A0E9T8N7_ANGAN